MLRQTVLATSLLILVGVRAAAGQTERHDDFDHLGEINKASIVMLAEIALVPRELASTIARGVEQVITEEAQPDARRSSNYLVFEARLLEVAGTDASRLHTGRSRQDIGSTLRRLALREALLDTYASVHAPRDELLALAARHVRTIVPAYTHGVQAQPTSLAHYLLAFASMADYRPADQALETAEKAQDMYRRYGEVLGGLAVDPQRALQEVDSDYATMTEVSDALLRHAAVPFRLGHHYASELTTYGRRNGKTPKQLTDDELRHIYREATDGNDLPVSLDVIRRAMDAEQMVFDRRGEGGPQPAEVERMLTRHRQRLAASKAWLVTEHQRLDRASEALEAAFRLLVQDR